MVLAVSFLLMSPPPHQIKGAHSLYISQEYLSEYIELDKIHLF